MIFRSQLSDFHQDHVKQNLNQFTLKLEEFMSDHRSNGWTRAAQPVLAANVWLERKTRLKNVESHRRMALDTRLTMDIRRQELFRGVMAGLKAEFSGWIDFAERSPELDLRLIFEAAGVAVATRERTPGDAKRTLADNLWKKTDERPQIALNPLVQGKLVNLVLFHELFHLIHPAGRGHSDPDTPVEILANCFAREMLLPAPAVQNLLTANVEKFFHNSIESVLRHSRREVFEFTFERSSVGRHLSEVVVQERPDFRDKYLRPSRDILSASLFGENCYVGRHPGGYNFSIAPDQQSTDAPILQFVTPDGLFYPMFDDESVRKALQDTIGFSPSVEGPFAVAVQIPKIHLKDMKKDIQIGGGQYFCLWARVLNIDIYRLGLDPRPRYHLIAIEDNDGSLDGRWLQNQAEDRPGGPLAFPADLVDDKRGASFEDWAVAVEESFLKPPSLNAMIEMRVWQAACISYRLFQGEYMTACECGNPDCLTFQMAREMAQSVTR